MFKKLRNSINLLNENVVKRYPISMILVLIEAVLLSIVVDMDYEHNVELLFRRIALFVGVTAVGVLLSEECFEKNDVKKKIGYIVSALLAAFFAYVLMCDDKNITISETFYSFVERIFVIYIAWIIVFIIYHMYKRSQQSFEKYCLDVFGGVMRTSIVYGLFALGLACILYVFDLLIFELDYTFILRVEVFLACALYVPGVILAISNVTDQVAGRFLSFIVKFVLMPLTIAAFIIIYIYIIKLVITFSLPSNEVFTILTALFSCGLPVWTMASYYKEDKIGKVGIVMPYAFIPFIILQIVCAALRINQYGLTETRYMGCFLIAFEIIYIIIYTLFNKRFLPVIFFVLSALVTLFVLPPYIKFDDAVFYSQLRIVQSFVSLSDTEKSALSKDDMRKLVSSYNQIRMEEKFSKYVSDADVEWIKECAGNANAYIDKERVYVSAYGTLKSVVVSGYSKLYEVSGTQNNDIDTTQIEIKCQSQIIKTIDLSDFIEKCVAIEKNSSYEFDTWFELNNEIIFDDGKLILEYIHVSLEDDVYTYIDFAGYYLEK